MRQVAYAATLSLLLAITGCIDYSEQIVLAEDGSGTVSLSYKVASDFIPGFGKPESEKLKSENEEFVKRFEAEGIGITHTSVLDLNDSRAYSADFAFDDDAALNSTDFYKSFSAFEIKRGKTLEYTRTISPREESEKKADDETEEKLAAMFEDNRFVFSVRMPARVTVSNGTINEDGYTVEWSFSFGEIIMLDKPAKLTAECRISE
jgi:hypothetical protein